MCIEKERFIENIERALENGEITEKEAYDELKDFSCSCESEDFHL